QACCWCCPSRSCGPSISRAWPLSIQRLNFPRSRFNARAVAVSTICPSCPEDGSRDAPDFDAHAASGRVRAPEASNPVVPSQYGLDVLLSGICTKPTLTNQSFLNTPQVACPCEQFSVLSFQFSVLTGARRSF